MKAQITINQKITLGSLLLVLLLATLCGNASASTIWYVNGVNGSDSHNCMYPTTACKTIGHAITLAHSGDSIMVAAATYTEHLTIGISLNVIGSSAGPTIIDGGGATTVVTIPNTSTSVILSRMTIRNGHAQAGAGIYNSGNLTITSTTISGNEACCIPYGGGGIYNVGTLTINNSTVNGNLATGPCSFYHLMIKCFGGHGGGIFSGGTLTINNSTVSGNGARCLIPEVCSSPSSGGDIYGSATLQNSIVAYSLGGNCSGTMTSKGYNLSSDYTCNFTASRDMNHTDPMLGQLQYNGGPTQTRALPSGSPAVDAGNPSGCRDSKGNLLKTDQRGYPRHDPEDTGGCDIGAYEKQGSD